MLKSHIRLFIFVFLSTLTISIFAKTIDRNVKTIDRHIYNESDQDQSIIIGFIQSPDQPATSIEPSNLCIKNQNNGWESSITCTIPARATALIHYNHAIYVNILNTRYTVGNGDGTGGAYIRHKGATPGVILNDPAAGDITFFNQNGKIK